MPLILIWYFSTEVLRQKRVTRSTVQWYISIPVTIGPSKMFSKCIRLCAQNAHICSQSWTVLHHATWTCGKYYSWISTLTEITPWVTQPRAVVEVYACMHARAMIMCSSAPFLSELLTTGEWRMMFDPSDRRVVRQYGDDLLPAASGLIGQQSEDRGCDGPQW